MPTMTPKELIKLLEKNGWTKVKGNHGSHQKFVKAGAHVTIPVHSKDMPLGLWKAILKQAGLKDEKE